MRIPKGLEVFEKHVSPELLAKMAEVQSGGWKVELKHFQFVIVLVNESEIKEVPASISAVVGTLLDHKAIFTGIISSLLVGILGVPFPDGNSPEARRGLVEALLRENGERVKIAHGECDGLVGNLGNKRRTHYGEIIPGFPKILSKLLETEFGVAVEISF